MTFHLRLISRHPLRLIEENKINHSDIVTVGPNGALIDIFTFICFNLSYKEQKLTVTGK